MKRAPLLLAFILFLTACTQAPTAETPSPTSEPPLESAPLTLAGKELETAVIWHSEYRGDFDYGEDAKLDELFWEWGFSAEDSHYEHYDSEGRVDLTLYFDEERERGLGIYGEYVTSGEYLLGFGFESVSDGKGWGSWYRWKEDPFALPMDCDEVVKECWEEWEYDQEGRAVTGYVYAKVDDPRFDNPDRVCLYQAEYTYDENSILRHKGFWHNFSIADSLAPHDSWYDAQGRLTYEEGYITHGGLYYYYIYEGDDPAPRYCLYIDDNVGYATPTLIRYPAASPIPEPLPEGTPLTLVGEELHSAVLIYDHTQAGGYMKDEGANLEALFTAWGFSEEEPFYEYRDDGERPLVKLWYDEKEGRGLGLRYEYDNYRGPKTCFGFAFTAAIPAEADRSEVYWHHWSEEPQVNETRLDEQGRTAYERRYVTHGHLDYFYIYDGDVTEPAYCLWMDDNLGTYFPELIRF